VTFIHEQDAGVYDAMNKGIAIAQGKWILILGANDQLASDSCLYELPLDLDVDLILGKIENIDKDHMLTPTAHRSVWSNLIYWKHTLHQQGVLYNRRCFQKKQFQIEYKVLGDYALHLQLRKQHVRPYHTNIRISKCDGNGLSKQFNWGLYAEELKLKKQHLSMLFYWIQIPWIAIKFLFKKMF
jgi:putative colanic acid biosynthesis glycosyltransferase